MTFTAVFAIFLAGWVARDLLGKWCIKAHLVRIEQALGIRDSQRAGLAWRSRASSIGADDTAPSSRSVPRDGRVGPLASSIDECEFRSTREGR